MSQPAVTDAANWRPAEAASPRIWVLSLVALGASILVILIAYRDTLGGMVEIWWRSATFGHGFLIAPVAALLVWNRREQIGAILPAPNVWGVAPLAAIVLLWMVARVTGVFVVENLAVIGIIQVAMLTILGWSVVRAMLFPIAYLVLMVPFGEFLIPRLQDVTATFVVHGLRALGVPVFHDGVFLTIPNGTFEVAEACAGLRFLIATVALGLLCANIAFHRWPRRVVFLTLTLVVPIIANGFRALGIILLAYYTNNVVAIDTDHVVYGWLFLGVVTGILLWIGYALAERKAVPVAVVTIQRPTSGRRVLVAAVAATIIAGIGPACAQWWLVPPATRATLLPTMPISKPWQWESSGYDSWRPEFRGADAEYLARYRSGDHSAELYIAFYSWQRQGAEVINATNSIASQPEWTRIGADSVVIMVAGKRTTVTATRIVSLAADKRLVAQWYWVDGRITGDPVTAKLLQAWSVLTGRREAAVVIVGLPYSEQPGEVLETLQNFVRSMPNFDAYASGITRTR